MKREPDIIRDVLLFLEDNLIYEDFESANPHIHNGYTVDQIIDSLLEKNPYYMRADISYAVKQLYMDGFIISNDKPILDGQKNIIHLKINDITPKGHDFIENVRSDKVWNSVKKSAAKVGIMSLQFLGMTAGSVVQKIATNPEFIQGIIQNMTR